jgi:hypothetical protein
MPVWLIAVVAFVLGVMALWLAEREFHRRGYRGLHKRSGADAWRHRAGPIQPLDPAILERGRVLASVGRGSLRRVIGVGAVRRVGDITVELISVEIRETGGRLLIRGGPARPHVPWADDELDGQSPLSLADDLGTSYIVRFTGGSSDLHAVDAEFVFAPRPPDAARRLTVSVADLASVGLTWDSKAPALAFDIELSGPAGQVAPR